MGDGPRTDTGEQNGRITPGKSMATGRLSMRPKFMESPGLDL